MKPQEKRSENGQVRALSDFRAVIHRIGSRTADRWWHYRQECEGMAGCRCQQGTYATNINLKYYG